MADVTVYFATNRVAKGPADQWQSYGPDVVPPTDPSLITYAAAFVESVTLGDENSGVIVSIQKPRHGGFDPGQVDDIVGSGKNLLVFIHGFANSFKDGIARAAYNREWFKASGAGTADTTVIAFSWPSLGELIAPPPHLLPHDYFTDRVQAGRSGFHIASFFAVLQPLLARVRGEGREVYLLAHSMGNYALQAAIESWFTHSLPVTKLFDEAFLAAADERYDTFEFAAGARLSRLDDLTPRISVYYSGRDIAMYFSGLLNEVVPLGHRGPKERADRTEYPPVRYRIVDCAFVDDYPLFDPPDASHQYYRRSAKVRADIARVMAKDLAAGGGLITL